MMEQEIINKTDKPNSIQFRYGGTGTDVKVYFNNEEDLLILLKGLSEKAKNINFSIEEFKRGMSNVNSD